MNKKNTTLQYVIMITSLILFIALTFLVKFGYTINFNNNIINNILNLRGDFFTAFFNIASILAGGVIYILIILVFLILPKTRFSIGIPAVIMLIVSPICNRLLKIIIKSPRPNIDNFLIPKSGYGFPSGHVMNGIAIVGMLTYLIIRYSTTQKYNVLLICISSLFLILTAVSRLYLGVHYLTDVIGGTLFAIFLISLEIILLNKYYFNKIK